MNNDAPKANGPDLAPFSAPLELERLALRVRQARRQKNWTQPELALRSGVALRTYKRFEQRGTGSMETLVKVAHALERVAALELLFPSPHKQPTGSLEQRLARVKQMSESRPPEPAEPT